MSTTVAAHGNSRSSIFAVWLKTTVAAAVAMTLADAILLQQKKAFFTGGFLSAVHASGPLEASAFLLGSVISDAGVLAPTAAFALWLMSRVRLTTAARTLAAGALALAPLIATDFVNYRLLSYFGDAFDFGLMFDLTGRQPGEIFAVASGHLVGPALLAFGGGGTAGTLVWVVNRFGPGLAHAHLRPSARVMGTAAAFFMIGLFTTAFSSQASDTLEDGFRRKPSGRVFGWLTERLTDVDRDGYGLANRTKDPDPYNAAVYPYAIDVPGNGVDENGVGGDLPAAAAVYQERVDTYPRWRQRPNVVLFVLESFRADAVGRRVNDKPVTPVLDALARQGVAASMAFSHNGYTAQSRFHLLSGSLPRLGQGESLVDDFNTNEYETAYFSGQDESFGGPALGVGFDRADVAYDARQDRRRRYSTFTTGGSLAVPHAVLQERLAEFLAKRDSGRPLFLYVNFHDTHYPYRHDGIVPLVSATTLQESEIEPSTKDALQEMYFNTAANVDRAVGTTLDLVTRALGAPPAVIVTADHGESLFDEGFLGHGYALNDVQTRIPLIIRGLPMVIAEPFGQSDLREAINAALSAEPSNDGRPRVFSSEGKLIFQYLGNIDRPRQIAFASGRGRTIYDFRTNRMLLADGTQPRPGELGGDAAAQFRQLVHLWERMMLATKGRGDSIASR